MSGEPLRICKCMGYDAAVIDGSGVLYRRESGATERRDRVTYHMGSAGGGYFIMLLG